MLKKTLNCIVIEILLLNGFLLCGCSYEKSIQGICVPSIIFSSLQKDSASLNKFVTLECFDGEAGYCHGTIIVEVIERIGEDFFIYSTQRQPINKRKEILSYIDVGIAYRYDNIDPRSTKEVFPKIFYVLNYGSSSSDHYSKNDGNSD